jgi:hypothetical protein
MFIIIILQNIKRVRPFCILLYKAKGSPIKVPVKSKKDLFKRNLQISLQETFFLAGTRTDSETSCCQHLTTSLSMFWNNIPHSHPSGSIPGPIISIQASGTAPWNPRRQKNVSTMTCPIYNRPMVLPAGIPARCGSWHGRNMEISVSSR